MSDKRRQNEEVPQVYEVLAVAVVVLLTLLIGGGLLFYKELNSWVQGLPM